MSKSIINSDTALTVSDLIDVLKSIPDPENTLIGIESEDYVWELTNITKININYRKVILLSHGDNGISRGNP